MSSSKQYRVIAPYVTMKTSHTQTGAPAILGFHEGAEVPDDVSAASIAHHLARGLIAEVPAKAMPVAAPQGDAGDADPAHGGTPDPDGGKDAPPAGGNPAPAAARGKATGGAAGKAG